MPVRKICMSVVSEKLFPSDPLSLVLPRPTPIGMGLNRARIGGADAGERKSWVEAHVSHPSAQEVRRRQPPVRPIQQ